MKKVVRGVHVMAGVMVSVCDGWLIRKCTCHL